MREIRVTFGDAPGKIRTIGVVGEDRAAQLIVDVQTVDGWREATFAILLRRAGGAAYVAEALRAEGGEIAYALGAADLAIRGVLELEVQAVLDEVVVKSRVFTFFIAQGMCGGDVPEPPAPGWVREVVEAGRVAEAAAVYLTGVKFAVDVAGGTLDLYALGEFAPIDIRLDDHSLEVWAV